MEHVWSQFLTVAIFHFLAVASPGPDFAIVLKETLAKGRRAGIFASFGVGIGLLVHISYCLLGLGLLISQSIVVFSIVKYCGAAYLCYIGFQAARAQPGSRAEVDLEQQAVPNVAWRSFLTGFMTNVLNPKATLFLLALFSITIAPSTPLIYQVGYGAWMMLVTMGWFSLVALFFSKDSVRGLFSRFGHWVDRVMGACLLAFGLKLALTEAR